MHPGTRFAESSSSGLSQLVDSLIIDAAGDRGLWSTLISVDWSREDLEDLREKTTDTILRRIMKTDLPPHETYLPTTGWELQLLDALPGDSFVEWLKRTDQPQASIVKFLKVVLLAITHSRKAFELDNQPENKACTVAGNLVCKIYAECMHLCRNDEAAKLTAGIAYKIWTWTGSPFSQAKWSGYEWTDVGIVGTIFLCTFMHEMRVRREFRTFCDRGGDQRWKHVVSWLEVRILMLKGTPERNMEDVADLVMIMFALSEMSGVAAKAILEGPFPRACICILSQKCEISDTYLSTSASFIHGISNSLGGPTEAGFTQNIVKLLQAGILVPLRNVILYTVSSNDHPSYIKSWGFLKTTVSAMLHYRAVPFVEKAFADLPPIWEEEREQASLKTWEKCLKEDISAKECSSCKQVMYCGKRCQNSAWMAGHKIDCKLYQTKELPTPRATQASKMFLAHVLAFMLYLSSKNRPESPGGSCAMEEANDEREEGEEDRFKIFSVGRRISSKDRFSIEKLQEYGKTIPFPTQFMRMLEAARAHKEYTLAAFAIADPPNERFYVFGLFRASDDTPNSVLIPIKAIEVTGIDNFVFSEE